MKPPSSEVVSVSTVRDCFFTAYPRFVSALAVGVVVCGLPLLLKGQSDDFNGGTDTGWTRANSLAIVGVTPSFTFPNDGFGGKAYRIQCPAPPIGDAGPARAGSYRTNIYTDFFAAVDVIAWDNNLDQSFGFLFRAENIGLAQTTGYVLNYNPQQASGGRGQLQINRVTGEQPTGTLGVANITLEPGRRYRFVLTGVGSEFTARVYDLADLTLPLASCTATDRTSGKGVVALFNLYRGSALTDPNAGRGDITFDNFFAAAVSSGSVALPGTPHGVPGMPQVVNRVPMSRANFHPFTNGISFTATTLSTNRIDQAASRMLLNGEDVWPNVKFSGSSSNFNVSFNGLLPNKVYDARIVLHDMTGRVSSNEWTFDTFAEDFLNSTAVKVIEAEDYNYDGGKFQDNPPPSGLTSGGAQINGNGVGYYDRTGVAGVDYFDNSTQPGGGTTPEYRLSDFTGTQAGSIESGASALDVPPANDTRRQKSGKLDLPEYELARTEGGEWLNYTRNFAPGDYNVHLRAACRAPQTVILNDVTGDRSQPNQATKVIGTFSVGNTGLLANYRYVPLTTADGGLALAHLSGLQTLRLTLGGPAQSATQYTMALNYLVFVPGTPVLPEVQLESALAVIGPYALDNTAIANPGASTISIPMNGASRFYRLRGRTALPLITGVQSANGTVTIRYGLLQ